MNNLCKLGDSRDDVVDAGGKDILELASLFFEQDKRSSGYIATKELSVRMRGGKVGKTLGLQFTPSVLLGKDLFIGKPKKEKGVLRPEAESAAGFSRWVIK